MHPSKRNAVAIAAGAILFCVSGAALAQTPMPSDNEIKMALDQAYAKAQAVSGGKNADYIPVLAKVDPGIFGIALVTADGRVYTKGDIKSEVSIQSISKVFTLALVMDQQNPEAVEQHKGQEENPLVNPGAITTTSMVKGDNRAAIWKSIIDYYSAAAGRPLK